MSMATKQFGGGPRKPGGEFMPMQGPGGMKNNRGPGGPMGGPNQ